uniref:hypothetical protein n=1 Tax=Spizellomyces sp. 'palustris' TaxID=117820 RepID=UPI0010FC3246|nr:hypothetical protein [Spizellomyces sp. 'palustris']QCQ69031.1 hypothetical protein [Spizellomyces sp. 'palustris']
MQIKDLAASGKLFRGSWIFSLSKLCPSDYVDNSVDKDLIIQDIIAAKGWQPNARPCYVYHEDTNKLYHGYISIAAAAKDLNIEISMAKRRFKSGTPINGFILSTELLEV